MRGVCNTNHHHPSQSQSAIWPKKKPLGHHAATWNHGVAPQQVEVLYGPELLRDHVRNLKPDHSNTLTDWHSHLIIHWCMGKPAALNYLLHHTKPEDCIRCGTASIVQRQNMQLVCIRILWCLGCGSNGLASNLSITQREYILQVNL